MKKILVFRGEEQRREIFGLQRRREKIFGLQRRRENGKYLEKSNVWSMEEKKNGKGKEKNFSEKENSTMCDKHRNRLCKDRARILD